MITEKLMFQSFLPRLVNPSDFCRNTANLKSSGIDEIQMAAGRRANHYSYAISKRELSGKRIHEIKT